MRARIGIDIGGTFTDFVLVTEAGAVHRFKCPSTPHDYAEAIGHGLESILAAANLTPGALSEVLHGTTVASNAILEGRGARTGLITTRGFRDILEIRTLRMPRLYDLTWDKPPVLVERHLRREVDERLDAQGAVRTPLNEASAVAALRALADAGVEAIAVCLLHAYANDTHERRIAELAAEYAPGIRLSLSCDVLPELREYERTSTTVINAYLQPVVDAYLDRLQGMLRRRGVTATLLLMQSGGGLMPAEQAARLPVGIVESGPAAGVIGAVALARSSGMTDLISFDMGGTTAKAALVTGGEASRAAEFQVGGGIMSGSRLLTGGGYTLRVPAIDLAEVGAGGGSVVWLDRAGAPQVGPRSAGAVPGPVCYGQGGTDPTITDCNLVLGWLGEAGLAGGTVRLDGQAARAALQARIAAPLGIEVVAAAYGAVAVATATMIRAIRAVSSERGRDPRDFALVAFGGNGGIFGPLVARSLGMRRVVVPPSPGLFSAAGLLEGVVEHQATRTYKILLTGAAPERVAQILAALADDVRANLAGAGHGGDGVALHRFARLRYQGQSFELAVSLDAGFDATAVAEAFGAEHERTYGHRAGIGEPVELVSLGVLGRGRATGAGHVAALPAGVAGNATRRAYFGAEGWHDVALIGRADLPVAPRQGPLLIEEYDATIVVPPDAQAWRDDGGNVVIEMDPAPTAQ
jgi:N-methylhydantoinase A